MTSNQSKKAPQIKIVDYKPAMPIDKYVLLIKSASPHETKTNKPYIRLVLQDPSGEISTNIWDAPPEQLSAYPPGKVAVISGTTELYQDNMQLRTSSLEILPDNHVLANPEYYVPSAPIKGAELKIRIEEYIAYIQANNPTYGKLLTNMMDMYGQNFYIQPASKTLHHAFVGGLAYHSLRMLQSADALCNVYPNNNRALIYTAIILHDFGKLYELSGHIGTDYTVIGNLVGHIQIVDGLLAQQAMLLNIDILTDEAYMLLRHTMLSHHGALEHGSPVTPRTREALLLHQLDEIDAKQTAFEHTITAVEPGTLTPRSFMFDNNALYRPHE